MLDSHAVILVDPNGVIRLWNAGAQRLFGYDAGAAIGKKIDLIIPEQYHERHWVGFHAAMDTGKPKLDQPAANLPGLHRDGTIARVPGRLIFLRDAKGAGIGVMAIFSLDGGPDPALPNI